MSKTVSQLDAAGYFVGLVDCDESPEEPGVYLIPGGCIDVAAPVVPTGQRARWVAGAWTFEADTAPAATDPPPQTLDEWRASASVSRFQARAALLNAGLLDSVQTKMSDPATPALARLAWTDAQEFRRMSPTVLTMGQALDLTDVQLDDLFKQAATITA